MSTVRPVAAVATSIGLALTIIGSGASASAASSGTASPVAAVAALFGPFSGAPTKGACAPVSGRVADCPITARLRYRLEHAAENGNILCRCQNPPRAIRWTVQDTNPFVAHVATRWYYGPTTGRPAFTLVVTVAREADGWRVDDAVCAGRPASGLYQPPTGPC